MMGMFSRVMLHTHGTHVGIAELLSDKLGGVGEFIDEVLIHGLIDTLKLVLFLFLTYLFMEIIEHKASDKAEMLMKRAGLFGPAIGGAFGAVPQCGFSAAAANLYTGRVITIGTLIAVFLSTSDEMLPILLAGEIKISTVLSIIAYKTAVGIVVGFAIDAFLRIRKMPADPINIDEICDNDNCHCERGVLYSALHHTLSVSIFIFVITVVINALMFFVGEAGIDNVIVKLPVISHVICAFVGLIPNCAASVALTKLAMSGIISVGAMMSGLFSGAGVGLLVLFKMNKRSKENIIIATILVASGVIFGIIADLLPFLSI